VSVESLGFFSKIRGSVFAVDLVEYIETTLGGEFLQHAFGEAKEELQQSIVAMNRGSRPEELFRRLLLFVRHCEFFWRVGRCMEMPSFRKWRKNNH